MRDPANDPRWISLAPTTHARRWLVIGKLGAIRWTPDGDVVLDGGGAATFERAAVVDVRGDRMQIVAHASPSKVALLLWIDAEDVLPQLQRTVVLHTDATLSSKPDEGTIELAPGELVEVLERRDELARVGTRDGGLTGWIDAGALGPTWENGGFERTEQFARVRPGTSVLARPGGTALFVLPDRDEHDARVLGKQTGWLRIEYVAPCRTTLRVRGFVRANTTEVTDEEPFGLGTCGAGGRPAPAAPGWGALRDAPPQRLAIDTPLRTADGLLVGRVQRDNDLRRGADGALHAATGWGLLPVHAPQ